MASCQLTNLLLYQMIQQRQQAAANPFLPLGNANLQGLGSNLNLNIANGATAGVAGLINPFPAINQNLIFPAETLRTYTTLTTFVTKMTTTAVLTIPLLFGNKPVPTTITRTKTYEVTTSELQTLTSTVRPTYITQSISPTPVLQNGAVTSSPTLNDVDEDAQSLVSASVSPKHYQKAASPEYEDEEASPNTNPSRFGTVGNIGNGALHPKLAKNSARLQTNTGGKRRKPGRGASNVTPKASPFTPTANSRITSRDRDYQDQQVPSRYGGTSRDRDDYYETDYQPYASSGKTNTNTRNTHQSQNNNNNGFSKRKYANIYEDDVAVDDDPAAAQYPDDYSYYTRRLKRGEQHGEEYQLEPSTDGDFSNNYQKIERCPPIPKAADAQTVTVTRTETKTVTKFLGQSTLASNINLNSASRAGYAGSSNINNDTPKSSRKRSRSRNRSSSQAAEQTYAEYSYNPQPAPTAESRTSVRSTTEDARAQILLRSRSRYNSNNNNNHNNNNQQYQSQPNYDYYRG